MVLVPDDDDTSCLYTEPVRIQRLQTIGAGATGSMHHMLLWKYSLRFSLCLRKLRLP